MCFSEADSKLIVWRLSGGATHELLTLHEGGGNWKYFSVNITSDTEYQVITDIKPTCILHSYRFHNLMWLTDVMWFNVWQIVLDGFKGEKGVLALDDIQYTVGVNCAGQKTDPTCNEAQEIFVSWYLDFIVDWILDRVTIWVYTISLQLLREIHCYWLKIAEKGKTFEFVLIWHLNILYSFEMLTTTLSFQPHHPPATLEQ